MQALPLAHGRCWIALARSRASFGGGCTRPQRVPSQRRVSAPEQMLRSRFSSTARLPLGIGGGETAGDAAARWPAREGDRSSGSASPAAGLRLASKGGRS
eukprot:10669757-Alexandrium_andersonii.AAC.1